MDIADLGPRVPQAPEAERALLGAILLYPEFMPQLPSLQPDDFLSVAHRLIFAAMLKVASFPAPPDILLVYQELEWTGDLGRVGGLAMLSALTDMSIMSPFHAQHYAELISKAAMDRRLITLGSHLAAIGYEGEGSEAAIRDARAEIDRIGQRANQPPARRVLPE